MKELSSKRVGPQEFQISLDGEVYTLHPAKKAKAMVGMMINKGGDDAMGEVFAAPKAMLAWFEIALNREHSKNRKQAGHGAEYVDGCQACRLYERLEDESDPLELETVFEAANWLLGEMADTPTGGPSA